MTVPIANTVQNIVDSESAKIDISTTSGRIVRLPCIYKESNAPHFFLVFPPKTLPLEIEKERVCPVSIKVGNTPFTLTAQILAIKGDRTLEMIAKKTINPESLREFFRIDTRIAINASFTPAAIDSGGQAWFLEGETLDISGSGILVIFPEEPKTRHKIEISIHLERGKDPIPCLGHIVRTKRLRRGRYQVAFHIDTILPTHRDSIISFCLQAQRHQLRDKVKTKG